MKYSSDDIRLPHLSLSTPFHASDWTSPLILGYWDEELNKWFRLSKTCLLTLSRSPFILLRLEKELDEVGLLLREYDKVK